MNFNSLIDLIAYFGLLNIVVFFLFFVGFFINHLFLSKRFFENLNQNAIFSISSFSAFLFIAFIFSIISTKFKTTQIIPLILLVLFYVKNKNTSLNTIPLIFNWLKSFKFKFYLKILGVNLISFIAIFYFNTAFNSDFYFLPDLDLLFYSKLSKSLAEYGIENIYSTSIHFFKVNNLNLYHFTELWFSAFFIKIFNLSEVKFMVMVTYPALLAIAAMSIASIFNNQKYSLFLSFFILWASNVFIRFLVVKYSGWDLIYFYARGFRALPGLLYLSTKMLIIVPLLVYALKFLKEKDFFNFLVFFSITGAIYITTLPGIAGGLVFVFIYLAYTYLINKGFSNLKKLILQMLIPGITFAIFLILFILTHKNNIVENVFTPNTSSIKSIIVFVIETIIKTFIVFWLFIVILLYSIKYKNVLGENVLLLIFFTGALLFSITAQTIIFNMENSDQITKNLLPTLLLVVTALMFDSLLPNLKIYSKILIFSAGIFFFIINLIDCHYHRRSSLIHDKLFIEAIQNELKNNKEVNFIVYTNDEYSVAGLNYVYPQAILVEKDIRIPLEYNFVRNDYSFCYQKTRNKNLCNEVFSIGTLNFLKQKNVQYLLLKNNIEFPAELQDKSHLLFADKNTGDKFYKLNIEE